MPKKRRSPCPIACTLDLIGDKWTLLVVRDLACGKTQFKDFLDSPERMASNILADRLRRLVDHGLVQRRADGISPSRGSYQLTARGKSLMPVLQAIAAWGLANVSGTEARLKPRL